jgi:membrane-associated phospholipid phosphatase
MSPDGPPALPPALRRPIWIMAVLAALVVAVLAAHYSGETAAGRLDSWAQTAVASLLPHPGPGTLLIDLLGEPLVTAVLAALLAAACLVLGRRRLAVVTVVGSGLTGVATTVLKPVIGRTIHGSHLSYPSGHTAAATVLALVLTLLAVDLLRAGRLPGVLLILTGAGAAGATMTWSQVAIGAHYATDTLGGFCTAIAVVPATALLVDWSRSRRHGTANPHRSIATNHGAKRRSGDQPDPTQPGPQQRRQHGERGMAGQPRRGVFKRKGEPGTVASPRHRSDDNHASGS